MLRTTLITGGLIALVLYACGGDKTPSGTTPTDQEGPSTGLDYMPLALGNTWKYEVRERGLTQVLTRTVTGVASIRNVLWYVINQSDTVRVNALNEYIIIRNGREIIQYKLDAKEGENWPLGMDEEGQEIMGMLVSRRERVEVPGGIFSSCLQFKFFSSTGTKVDTTYMWLAPEVGFIKKTSSLEKTLFSVLLEAIISGKTYP